MSSQPSKRLKTSHSKPLKGVLPKRSPAELINAIPPPPEYVPLPYRQIQRPPLVQLPPQHVKRDPYSLFTLYLTEAHFETITANTNRYAEVKKAGSDRKRLWRQTSAVEIKVFIATFIYMGVVRLPAYEDYWNPKFGKFVYAEHISLNYFKDLKRYLHISNPTPERSLNKSQKDDLEDDLEDNSEDDLEYKI